MKKLLILMLILGLTSIASATVTLNISVDLDKDGPGEPIINPAETDIYLTPSQEIWIDIHGTVPIGEYLPVWLIAQGPGTMSGGTVLQGTGTLGDFAADEQIDPPDTYTYGDFMNDIGYPGVSDNIAFIELIDGSTDPGDLDGILFDYRVFHCDGPEDVVLTLIDGSEGNFGYVYSTAYLHQPEPITIALLGLGGLFLRRRR